MDAFTLVTVVRALVAAGQSDTHIAATLTKMGFDASEEPAERVTDVRNARANGREPVAETDANPDPQRLRSSRRGTIPAVRYKLVRGMTAHRIAAMQLPPQQFDIAMEVLNHGPMQRREITERLAHSTHKVTESAVYALRVRGVLESEALEPAAPAPARKPVGRPRGVPVVAERRKAKKRASARR